MAQFNNIDYNFTRVNGTAAGTTQIKVGYGHLGGVYVGPSSSGTVTYYDNGAASATNPIAVVPQVYGAGTLAPGVLNFNCRFVNGLVAVQSAGTADQTVIWD